jgi:hypothetical protein
VKEFLFGLEHHISILSLLMQLIECLDFGNAEPFKILCGPILQWMIDDQYILQRLKSPSSELQHSELEKLWDIVTKILPENMVSLESCYIKILKETYEYAGIPMPE